MSYYPESKIIPNQYTSGKEYQISDTAKEYTGRYYILSNGKVFSGTPNDKNSKQLEKISVQSDYSKANNSIQPSTFVLPNPFYPSPKEEDYKRGYLQRYFLKRRNADYTTIREISQDDYTNFTLNTDLGASLYVGVILNWKITGPINNDYSDKNFPKPGIIETNQKLVKLKEGVMPGFSNFFKDYKQFAK